MSIFYHGWLWLNYLGIVNMVHLCHIAMIVVLLCHILTLIKYSTIDFGWLWWIVVDFGSLWLAMVDLLCHITMLIKDFFLPWPWSTITDNAYGWP